MFCLVIPIKEGNSILGDFSNLGMPVIDLEKVKATGSKRIQGHKINHPEFNSYTYYNFERYTDSTSITRKIAKGFSINLILFRIGRKELTTEIFKSAYTSTNESVYGELNASFIDSKFKLDDTSGARKKYAQECLTDEFREDFSSTPIGGILSSYGPYVLTGYETGGKALGLFAAKTQSGASYRIHEKDLKDSIQASFTYDKDSISAKASFSFKMNNGNVSASNYNIKDTQAQIRLYGGRYSGSTIIGPVDTKNMSIDLTSWVNSLSDVNTHTIINISDEGLMPLSAFVLEKNFKNRIDDTASGYLESKTENFSAPYIEVVRVYAKSSNGQRLYEIAPVLNTRQGDKIVLSNGKYKSMSDSELLLNSNNSHYLSCVTDIALQKREYFDGIGYVQNVDTWLDPYDRKPLCIRLDDFDETMAYKYIDEKQKLGFIYIPSSKVALSYYISDYDGDYVLDDYGIRDWVDNLEQKKISLTSLSNYYTIIGL